MPRQHTSLQYNGTDDGPGTAERPWATINHAADKAVAGDTVVVRGGRCSPPRLRFAPAPGLRSFRLEIGEPRRSHPDCVATFKTAHPAEC